MLSLCACECFSKADAFFSVIKGSKLYFYTNNLCLKLIPYGSCLFFVIHFLFCLLLYMKLDAYRMWHVCLKLFLSSGVLCSFDFILFFLAFMNHISPVAFLTFGEFIHVGSILYVPPPQPLCQACLFVNQSGVKPAARLSAFSLPVSSSKYIYLARCASCLKSTQLAIYSGPAFLVCHSETSFMPCESCMSNIRTLIYLFFFTHHILCHPLKTIASGCGLAPPLPSVPCHLYPVSGWPLSCL